MNQRNQTEMDGHFWLYILLKTLKLNGQREGAWRENEGKTLGLRARFLERLWPLQSWLLRNPWDYVNVFSALANLIVIHQCGYATWNIG